MNLGSNKGLCSQYDDLSSGYSLFKNTKKIWGNNKAQETASSAANLIAILAALIVLYILFVPPDIRQDLLNDGDDDGKSSSNNDELISTLIDTQPGLLKYIPEDEFDHTMPAFHLKESKYSMVIAEENPFQVKRSWFSNKVKEIPFTIASIKDVNSLKLAFNVDNMNGNLIIEINGNEIFNKELKNSLVNPIDIPTKYLTQNNILKFYVSPPDLEFWKSNNYDVDGFVLTGDFVDTSTLENTQKFYLESVEYGNIDESRLIFSPTCTQSKVGKLVIMINNESIYSSIPDCNMLNYVPFLPSVLNEKQNVLSFISTKGEYTMSLINVRTNIGEQQYPKYYFELSQSTYDKIKNNDYSINMTLALQDDDKFKEGYILVNSAKMYIDTKNNKVERILDDELIVQGTNTIELRPLNSFEVLNLKVALYD